MTNPLVLPLSGSLSDQVKITLPSPLSVTLELGRPAGAGTVGDVFQPRREVVDDPHVFEFAIADVLVFDAEVDDFARLGNLLVGELHDFQSAGLAPIFDADQLVERELDDDLLRPSREAAMTGNSLRVQAMAA